MTAVSRVAAVLLCAAAGLVGLPAASQSHPGAYRPHAAKAQSAAALRAPAASAWATRMRLGPPDPEAIATLKRANARMPSKRLDIGIGRDVPSAPESASVALRWSAVPGGLAAHWEVASAEARALRVALRFERLEPSLEVRFAGNARPDVVYGPFTAGDVAAAGAAYWSPVLEGDTATVELFLPRGVAPGALAATLAQVSHLFVNPADPKAESLAKAAGACEVNFICRAASDPVLAQVGSSVAKMAFINEDGGSSLCTGTLLNPADGSFLPYFYSAAHCFATQSSASTLTTYWYDQSTSCATNAPSPATTQIDGGATLLYANPSTDVLLVRLNRAPPPSVFHAGWDATTLALATPATAIHHPAGDLKKVSLGTVAGFDASDLSSGTFARVQWNGLATGVTEGGSSGSAIFTGADLRVRGGLQGGLSSCAAAPAELWDLYSRLDLAFPLVAQFLDPAAAPALGPNALANPGFESGTAAWTQASTTGRAIIANDPSAARSGSAHASFGGVDSGIDTLHQSLAIPAGTARLRFWFRIGTAETSATRRFDRLVVSVADAASGAILADIGSLSNLDRTETWVQSPIYDLAAFGNRTVRLQFRSTNDGSLPTTFRIDDLTLNGTLVAAGGNHTALWFNGSESGWGVNVSHQGDTAFATLFTYTSAGTPMWLVMPAGARQQGASTFMGELYRTTGPPFDASPFPPLGPGNITRVGAMTVDFNAASAVLSYRVDDAYVSKAIQKQVFGAAAASCQGTSGSRASATNYQDLWWNPDESGWGINLTHQGNTIFATLFTYAADGQGLWLVMDAGVRQSDGSFSGKLFRTTGPAFDAVPFAPIGPGNITEVGTMRLTFADGENGTLEYTYLGTPVTKSIRRQVFATPMPLCSG